MRRHTAIQCKRPRPSDPDPLHSTLEQSPLDATSAIPPDRDLFSPVPASAAIDHAATQTYPGHDFSTIRIFDDPAAPPFLTSSNNISLCFKQRLGATRSAISLF